MRRTLLVLSGPGVLVLTGGVLWNAFGQGFACFDSCPDNLADDRLRIAVETIGPGLAIGIAAWIIGMVALARWRGWGAIAALLLLALPPAAVGAILAAWSGTSWGGVSDTPAGRLLALIYAAALTLNCVMVLLLLLFAIVGGQWNAGTGAG